MEKELEKTGQIALKRLTISGGSYGLYLAEKLQTDRQPPTQTRVFLLVMPSIEFLKEQESSGSIRSILRQSQSQIKEYSLAKLTGENKYKFLAFMKHEPDKTITEEIRSFLETFPEHLSEQKR
jgi:hypothetical protein